MSELGIGIIGSGFMGRTYAETLTKFCERVRLVGVTGGSRAAELAKDYDVTRFDSVEAMLDRDDVGVVFVATPHHLHAEQALAAAKAGKHVLIEKPMATSVADCDAILAACEAHGVRHTICFGQRTRKCNIRAKQLIDEGAIGKPLQFCETQLVPTGMAGLPSWQADRENLGTLFGHAIHNFDRIRWFSGSEIKTVYAKCCSLEPQVRVEGTSMVLMELTDGRAASLWSSFQLPKPSFERSGFGTRIIGETGLIDLDAFGELRMATGGEWQVMETQEPIDWAGMGFLDPVRLASYHRLCQDFVDAIAEDRPPAITGWDGRQAVAAALAAYESSETHQEVELT
jgi:predicted dehydrogenase